MPQGPSGDPDPSARLTFVSGAATPVDLKIGPGGDLFYVDYNGGTIRRIQYIAVSQPPKAVLLADRTDGPVPLAVQFDASGSSDPDPGDTITYSWDLDGNGIFGDSAALAPRRTYTTPGVYAVKLRVTDPHGATDTDAVTITAGNSRPTTTITAPLASTTWKVGDTITFSGGATDPEQGVLPASALTWTLVIQHCPSNCHEHTVQTFTGVSSGSFVTADHDYPTHLELRLTATDSGGLTDTKSVLLYPKTVALTFNTSAPGLNLVVGAGSQPTPFTRTVIVNSAQSVSAPSPQTLGGSTFTFQSWSDGGARSHNITAPAAATTYTATFTTTCGSCDDQNPCTTDACTVQTGCTHTPLANGISCGDGNTCNGAETCQAGACASGTPLNCNDQNACTTDACDAQTGCTHTPIQGCVGGTCGNGVLDPGEMCDDGNTANGDCCSSTCTITPCSDLTQLGTIIARVPNPIGGGNKNLEVIRDGDLPPVGSTDSSRQYDSWDGPDPASEDWIGYVYPTAYTFQRVVFQEGKHFVDGGWFETLTVQVRQGGAWNPVAGLTITPAYPGTDNGVTYETYTLTFADIVGDGIRIYGAPGGSADFISVGELRAYGTSAGAPPTPTPTSVAATTATPTPVVATATSTATPTATPTVSPTPADSDLTQLGTIIARVPNPIGGGNKNLEVIRDGDL
ncbi:MAG: PKD domain-containing protein, partial [Candidatus Binatia bacterium]